MTLRDRRRNARFDHAIKPFKKQAPKNHDLDLSQNEEQKTRIGEDGRLAPIPETDGQDHVVDEEEQKQKLREQHEQLDIEMSSSLSIVKMTLNSLGLILEKVIDSSLSIDDQKKFEFTE